MADIVKIGEIPLTVIEAAKKYIERGFAPTPAIEKAMKLSKWQERQITPEKVEEYFQPNDNIALVMGLMGGNYVTVDIDCPEAMAFSEFLPKTEMAHGRKKNPYSHYTYRIDGDEPAVTTRYKDVGGSSMVEMLGKGSAVLVEPSIHPSGDSYVLHGALNPATVSISHLQQCVKKMYLAALLLRHYPSKGSRQDFALGISALLLRAGWDRDNVVDLVGQIAKEAGDEELDSRIKAVSCTEDKIASGHQVASTSLLNATIGEPITKKLQGLVLGQNGKSNQVENDIAFLVAGLNAKHAVCMVGGKASILNEVNDPAFGYQAITLSSAGDLGLLYKNQRHIVGYKRNGEPTYKSAAEIWLEHPERRQYLGIAFDPQSTPSGYYNLFRGFPIEPVEGDCGLYLSHLRNVICRDNDDHFDYLIQWMAHAVQRPWELPEVAIVVRGKQGTGKGTMMLYFGELFGQHFISLLSMKQITGQFNGHLADKLVVCANEALWGGDKIGEGFLKGMITDPTVPIEYKFKDLVNVRNYKRLVVTSNEDWAVPIGVDDRRYVVLDAADCYKENKDYFSAIAKQMSSGGLPALMHHLTNVDIGDFQPRSAPYTPAAFGIKLKSSDPIYTLVYELLTDQILPEYEVQWSEQIEQAKFYKAYKQWCSDSKVAHPHSQKAFTMALREIFPGMEIKKATKANYLGKRPYNYHLLPADTARGQYEVAVKAGVEIWDI